MKQAKRLIAQGDVLFIRVNRVPGHAVRRPRGEEPIVCAHSETGHHHSVADRAVSKFEVPGSALECYLYFDGTPDTGGIDVVHHRSFDTHETIRLLGEQGAVWKVVRQREWSPWGDRMVMD